MTSVITLISYTIKENIRNKVFYVLLLFVVTIIALSGLIAILGGEESIRIVLDVGLACMEFFGLLMIVFTGTNIILEQINSKVIYLILVRPLCKWEYLLGRYLGILGTVYISILGMSIIHIVVLFIKGWHFTGTYLLVLLSTGIKIAIIGSVALFFSLFSTSVPTAIVFTFLFWILGHFGKEMKFLAAKTYNIVTKTITTVVFYIVPNLQYFTWRDIIGRSDFLGSWLLITILYALAYCTIAIILSLIFFSKKEF